MPAVFTSRPKAWPTESGQIGSPISLVNTRRWLTRSRRAVGTARRFGCLRSKRGTSTAALPPNGSPYIDVVDERTVLLSYLTAQRHSVLAIVEGLKNELTTVSVVPSGWTVVSMIEHLAGAEEYWFRTILAGDAESLGASHSDTLQHYRSSISRSDIIVSSFALDAVPLGDVPMHLVREITCTRDVILHMIEETARHAGHLDIARELLDGATGLGPR
jgi:Protein of unknown function (DUF664)